MNRNYSPQSSADISDYTGFDHGDEFESEAQVREYFTVASIRALFGADTDANQDLLDAMAESVINNRWHCAF